MADLKMPEINTVMIAGNLTSDPSFRNTSNGTPVANFYIASNRRFKDNNGNWRENVCYIGVVAWHKLAESCYESLQKGSAVLIDGEIQSRTWKNTDGSTKNVVEIKARRIQFLNKRGAIMQSFDDDEDDDVVYNDSGGPEVRKSEKVIDNDNKFIRKQQQNPEKKSQDQQNDLDFGYSNLKL